MSRSVIALSVGVAIAVGAASCKSNSIDNNTSNTNSVGANVIGPAGGVVLGPDGTSVRVAANALTKDTTISITVAEPSQYPPPPGSLVFDSKVYSFEPHGLTFLTPAVVTIPLNPGTPTTGITGLHAALNGSWDSVPAVAGIDSAQISTPSFSFFALGNTATVAEAGPSCSGRTPDNGAPTGTISGMSGTHAEGPPGNQFTVDLATLVDGVASSQGNNLSLTFTSYAKACGHVKNGISQIGGTTFSVMVLGTPPYTTQTYGPNSVAVAAGQLSASTPPGPCSGAPVSGGGGPGNTGTGVTITAIDSTHVAGSFDFTPSGGSQLKGTFDLPFCTANPNLNPTGCCVN